MQPAASQQTLSGNRLSRHGYRSSPTNAERPAGASAPMRDALVPCGESAGIGRASAPWVARAAQRRCDPIQHVDAGDARSARSWRVARVREPVGSCGRGSARATVGAHPVKRLALIAACCVPMAQTLCTVSKESAWIGASQAALTCRLPSGILANRAKLAHGHRTGGRCPHTGRNDVAGGVFTRPPAQREIDAHGATNPSS